MAVRKRNNGAGRWAVLLAGGLAAVGFWAGVANGPQPAQAGPPETAIVQPSPTPSRINGDGRGQRAGTPRLSQPSAAMPAPRLRTRAS